MLLILLILLIRQALINTCSVGPDEDCPPVQMEVGPKCISYYLLVSCVLRQKSRLEKMESGKTNNECFILMSIDIFSELT